jgi:hypothetical protein
VDAGNLLHGGPEGILLLLPAHPVVSLEAGQLLGWQLVAVNSCKLLAKWILDNFPWIQREKIIFVRF